MTIEGNVTRGLPRVIPVLDIKAGRVVHGVRGQRSSYLPIESVWTSRTDPVSVATAVHRAYGLQQFYIADLDCFLADAPPAWPTYDALLALGFSLAIDAGLAGPSDRLTGLAERGVTIVAGLETLAGEDALAAMVDHASPDRLILSLDVKSGQPMGPWAAVLTGRFDTSEALAWIVERAYARGVRVFLWLDLDRVGTAAGLAHNADRLPTFDHGRWWIGGGVRDDHDLLTLQGSRFEAVLVATALHRGLLNPTTQS